MLRVEINEILENVCAKDALSDKVWEAFEDAYGSDCECPNKKVKRIARQYMDSENGTRQIIDDLFITLCGWSFLTLVERTMNNMADSVEERGCAI